MMSPLHAEARLAMGHGDSLTEYRMMIGDMVCWLMTQGRMTIYGQVTPIYVSFTTDSMFDGNAIVKFGQVLQDALAELVIEVAKQKHLNGG